MLFSPTHTTIDNQRKEVLKPLIDYVQIKKNEGSEINLNFICTHNSRRSQFAQVWAVVAASHFNIKVNSFSGGVKVTVCNKRTIASLKRSGFSIASSGVNNPHYSISSELLRKPTVLFSKLFANETNPKSNFIAIMTCSHADKNCPFISGADERIAIRYDDPKEFDDTNKEEQMYDERSHEIASELFYVFSQLK